jgi:hypothetical protein
MAERVGIARLQDGAAIAVDDDRGAGRGIFLGPRVAVHMAAVTAVGMMHVHVRHVNAVMVPRIGGFAGDGEDRCYSGETHGTATKPPTGFGT